MKKIFLIIAICFLTSAHIMAQKAISIQGKKVKDGVIYLTFDGKNLEYFTPDKTADSKKNIQETITFSLKDDNTCNIYLKWINPLKYRLTWKDTTYVDERDKAIDDFVDILASQFGSSVASLNRIENATLTEKSKKIKGITFNKSIDSNDLTFNNTDLTLLYILLHSYNGKINQEFSNVTDSLKKLDSLVSINVSVRADSIFSNLLSLENPNKVLVIVAKEESQIKKIEVIQTIIENLQKSITKTTSEMTIVDNPLYDNYTKTVISKFINQTVSTTNSNKNLTAKLKPVLEILKNSINEESANAITKGFYKARTVGFDDGKKIKTDINIIEFEYNKETKAFSKKSDILSKSLVFQKYDFFAISVSTGVFYSNTTLRGYGVANSFDGQFTVTEDDITKNSAVTAVFLNFNFDIGSRYLAPLAQIGVDPTKKRPFLLLGGGFSIPSARIALSGGPIWTWSPSLDKLSVGQTISSTTDLENDIEYKFDMKPKGWYLGIQYNF